MTGTSRRALLVTGPYGSETSTLARVLNLVGAALPEHLRPPADDGDGAPRFWEPARVVELNADALRAAGALATEAASVPPEWFETVAAESLSRQAAWVLEEEFGRSRLFVVEDTQLARLVPLWEAALARAGMDHAFVITLRNPLVVARALEQRKGLPAGASLLVWLHDLVSLELASRGRPRRFVSYERLLRDWPGQLAEIATALQIEWPRSPDSARAEIEEFLSAAEPPEEAAASELDADPELAAWASRCYDAALELQGEAAQATLFDEVRGGLAADAGRTPAPAGQGLPPARVQPEPQRRAEELLADLADANRSLAEETARIARLEAAAATLETEAEELRVELAQAQSDLAERTDRVTRAEKRVEVLDAELETLKTQLEDARGLASSETDQVARLEAILSEREAEAREQREQIGRLGDDLQKQTERAARAEERTQALEEQIEKLSGELADARAGVTGRIEQVARLEGALEAREVAALEQRERLERLQDEVRERSEQSVRAEARAEAVEREVERLTADLGERDRRLEQAHERVREAREETARLASELEAAQAEHTAGADAVARADAQQRRLTESAKDLGEQVAALSSELAAAQRKVQQSQSQLVSVRMLAERRRAEAESLRHRLDEAQAERGAHENELAAAQAAARASAARTEALLRDLHELREQLAQRDGSLKAVADEATSLRERAKGLSEELRAAREGSAKREEELKQKARQETQALSEELETARADFAERGQEQTEKARTLTQDLDEAKSEAARLRGEAATLREDLGKARGRAKNVTEALESAQAESTRHQAAARQAQERVSSLERRLETVNERLERTTRSATEAKNEAAALRGDLDDARYQLGVVERALDEARGFEQRSAELEVELERARAVIAMRRTIHGELYRSLSQFFSWLVRRPSREHLRHVRTYLQLRRSGLFDERFYRTRYLDVTSLGLNPLMHYIEHGVQEQRDPSADFSTQRYLAHHPGLLESGVNPLLDYSRRVKAGELTAPARRPALPPVAALQVVSEPPPDEAQAGQAAIQPTLEIVAGARGVDYSDFTVLLARQRSGTNALRSVLRSHKDIYCYSEVFSFIEKDSHEPIPGMPDGVKVSRHDVNFHTFLQRHGLADHLSSWSTGHEIAFLDYLEYLRCFTSKPNLLLDVKYNSVHFVTEPWAYNITSPYFFDLLLKHNLKVLNVTRRNYLRYVISNAKARQTGRWHSSRRRGGFSDLAIEVDIEFMMRELERCYDEDVAVAKRFVDYHNYRSFEYADIFGPEGATPEFLTAFADWLGVPPAFQVAPAFKKQSSLTLEQTVQNYDEVVAALTGTKFEYCLEDEPIYRTSPDPAGAAPQSRSS